VNEAKIRSVVESFLLPYLEKNGFELYDIEYVKEGGSRFLRIFVDKEGGIDVEECTAISEFASARLDELDPIPEAYFLEVSSPGAERPLKTKAHVEKAVGKLVYIKTYEPVGGFKEFEGVLEKFDGNVMTVSMGRKRHEIPYDKVAFARLAIAF